MNSPSALIQLLGIIETELLTNKKKILLGFVTIALLSFVSPIITSTLPIIAEIYNLSNLLPGLEIRPTPEGAMRGSFEELELWGSIILAILIAGTISGEKEKGTFLFLTARPVSSRDIVLGKSFAWLLIAFMVTITVFIISTSITLLIWRSAPIIQTVMVVPCFLLFFLLLIGFAIAMSAYFQNQIASIITILVSWVSTIYVIEKMPIIQIFTPFFYSQQALNFIEGLPLDIPLVITLLPLTLGALICLGTAIFLVERER